MIIEAHPRPRKDAKTPPPTRPAKLLIYGTGIRNAINPCVCNTNHVLIYGNHASGDREFPPDPTLAPPAPHDAHLPTEYSATPAPIPGFTAHAREWYDVLRFAARVSAGKLPRRRTCRAKAPSHFAGPAVRGASPSRPWFRSQWPPSSSRVPPASGRATPIPAAIPSSPSTSSTPKKSTSIRPNLSSPRPS